MPSDETYKLRELCHLAGVTPRTVHYYIQQGLLPPATSLGPRASYDRRHLLRLQLIRRLQRDHLPLAVIREKLSAVADSEMQSMLEPQEPEPRPRSGRALDYIRNVLADSAPAISAPPRIQQDPSTIFDRAQWERISIAPSIELHVRRPLSRSQNKQVDRLIDEARRIFSEES